MILALMLCQFQWTSENVDLLIKVYPPGFDTYYSHSCGLSDVVCIHFGFLINVENVS